MNKGNTLTWIQYLSFSNKKIPLYSEGRNQPYSHLSPASSLLHQLDLCHIFLWTRINQIDLSPIFQTWRRLFSLSFQQPFLQYDNKQLLVVSQRQHCKDNWWNIVLKYCKLVCNQSLQFLFKQKSEILFTCLL